MPSRTSRTSSRRTSSGTRRASRTWGAPPPNGSGCPAPRSTTWAGRRSARPRPDRGIGERVGQTGPLSAGDWEAVRLHPYQTGRVLGRAPFLARLSALASLHHERLDGSGYFRGSAAAQLSPAARVLAAADAYHAMREPRPHRAP